MAKFQRTHYELVITGAGPTGLAAALYAAREGMSVLVLEKAIVGGMAAITNLIDNYPGFENGVGGLELADHLYEHAVRFGAEVQTGVEVTGLIPGAPVTVTTTAGQLEANAALIATGSTYKRLGVPGETEYIGRGVHFCATCDAPLYRGKNVIVVGGGNSAIQESLFIARFAQSVTLLVRGPELAGTAVLMEQLGHLRNVIYSFNTRVDHIRGNLQGVTGLQATDTETGEELDFRTDAVFVFIGLDPNTQPFAAAVKLDPQGFVLAGPDFTTNQPGVFAAGDVRSGSTWQIASAVGEGVNAALEIRHKILQQQHLDTMLSAVKAPAKKKPSKRKTATTQHKTTPQHQSQAKPKAKK